MTCHDRGCPCVHPRTFMGPWVVFSTGQRTCLTELPPETETKDGRVRILRVFQWEQC
jgi:hypothetical protein